jgi:hypothetical protein
MGTGRGCALYALTLCALTLTLAPRCAGLPCPRAVGSGGDDTLSVAAYMGLIFQSVIRNEYAGLTLDEVEKLQLAVTIPAYYDLAAKSLMKAVCRRVHPSTVTCEEPVAAVLALAACCPEFQAAVAACPQDTVLAVVFDAGGGTVDVSTVALLAKGARLKVRDGEHQNVVAPRIRNGSANANADADADPGADVLFAVLDCQGNKCVQTLCVQTLCVQTLCVQTPGSVLSCPTRAHARDARV